MSDDDTAELRDFMRRLFARPDEPAPTTGPDTTAPDRPAPTTTRGFITNLFHTAEKE